MCQNHEKPRLGYRLEDGEAHERDHAEWSRRSFMASLGLGGTGLFLGGTPALRGFFSSPVLQQLSGSDSDRVLVVVRLAGGNDGLNTIVPWADPAYYDLRSRIGIPEAEVLKLGQSAYGLHPAMESLHPWFNGQNPTAQGAIVHGVGYPDPSLSHFDSTDIWHHGSRGRAERDTGWLGRYLEDQNPEYWTSQPSIPLAIQLGGSNTLSLEGSEGGLGMAIGSGKIGKRLLDRGAAYEVESSPANAAASEVAFVRAVANNSFRYAAAVHEAGQQAENDPDAEYGSGRFADSLSTVARLIKGRLGTRIYMLTLGGFDTHAGQPWKHQQLLRTLSTGISGFLTDLGADASRTLVMTVSEFGRRARENANRGTDHGTAAPLMLFGGLGSDTQFYGEDVKLDKHDDAGNLLYTTDFRDVYASVLSDWFGLDDVASILPDAPGTHRLGFAAPPVSRQSAPSNSLAFAATEGLTVLQNHPEPFNPTTTISFELRQATDVSVRVYDIQGRLVARVADGSFQAGTQQVRFDASRLPSGTYFYRVVAAGSVQTRKMTLLK